MKKSIVTAKPKESGKTKMKEATPLKAQSSWQPENKGSKPKGKSNG